jgi:hypothetical protein
MKSLRRTTSTDGGTAPSGLSARVCGPNVRRLFIIAATLGSVCVGSSTLRAENSGDASSSRAAHDEAVKAIPWQRLGPDERRIAQTVVNSAGIYRRLPTRVIDCDPEMFTFLVQHPEVIADVWRVMGISRVKLDKLPGGTFRGTDGAGTSGTVRFLATEWGADAKNTALIFADGSYEGKPFVMPLKAQTIALMRSEAMQERNGRRYRAGRCIYSS